MQFLTEDDTREFIREGKRAHNAISQLIHTNNIHLTEEFIDIFRERFGFLFRNSMKNYSRKKQFLMQTSKVINYLETILLPNFDNDFDLNSLSPEIQHLLFRSINEAYIQFKKRHNLPM